MALVHVTLFLFNFCYTPMLITLSQILFSLEFHMALVHVTLFLFNICYTPMLITLSQIPFNVIRLLVCCLLAI